MSKNLFVTGTGTDIGKTYVAALLVKKLRELGYASGYYKAAMSGNVRDEAGNLIPGDARFVRDRAGISQPLEEMCPYVYEHAYSPHLASCLEGNPVDLQVVEDRFRAIAPHYDYITLEGSGGILCPLCFDERKIQLEDVVKGLDLNCLIVADAGLGTINNVVLTVHYMRAKEIPIAGILFNHFHPGDVMEEDNLKMCEYMTGLKVAACVSDGDRDLHIDPEILKSFYR